MKDNNVSIVSIGILAALSLIWGGSFFFIKKSLLAFDSSQVAALRMGITMLCFIPVGYTHLKKIKSKKVYFHIFLMAMFGNAIPSFLFPIAQTQIDSSLAGILNASTPIFVLIVGFLVFKVETPRHKILGVLVGLIGALLLILYGQDHKTGTNNWYGLYALLATFCYGMSANIIKEYLQNISPLTSTTIAFMLIGPISWAYIFSTDFLTIMNTHPQAMTSLGSVSFLAIFGTGIASLIYVRLIQITDAVFSSLVSYIIPIVALTFGAIDGEIITLWHALGIILIFFGVHLARK